MSEIVLRYKLTEDEVVAAMRARLARSWSIRVLFIATAIFAIGSITLNWLKGDTSAALITFLPIVVIVGLFLFFYYSPFTRTRMRNEPRFFIEQTWRFSESGTVHQTENGETRNAWSAYVQAGETARFFFLFFNQNLVAPIPKRAFANVDELNRFRNLLQQKIKTKSM